MFPPSSPILIALLNRRLSKLGKEEFLVEWKGLPRSEASWIDKEEFEVQFQGVNLEDKIRFDEVGNVTSTNPTDQVFEENGPNNNYGPGGKSKRVIRKPKRYED
jgi:hypothetical protein